MAYRPDGFASVYVRFVLVPDLISASANGCNRIVTLQQIVSFELQSYHHVCCVVSRGKQEGPRHVKPYDDNSVCDHLQHAHAECCGL